MITEKYCNEILQQYPEYITKDQMYRICHISKKTCLFLLESGLVPNIDSGKKTRRFKIKTVDVIQYLKDRDDYPELFKAPDGFYKGKGGDKKAPSFDEVFTQEDLIRMRQYYERLLKNNPDVMSVEQVAQFTGWKRVRKYGAYCTGITQNVDDLLQSHTARTMLANSEFIIMLNQASTDRIELAKLLNISDLQMSYITNVGAGQGLLKVGSSLVPFINKFPRNTELYRLMTTKFGEV